MLQERVGDQKEEDEVFGRTHVAPDRRLVIRRFANVFERHEAAAYEILEQTVALGLGVPSGALRSRTRGRAREAFARQVAMYLAHVVYGQSLTEIGMLFGRDRSTVSHACGVIEDRRDDPEFDRSMERLECALCRFAAASLLLAPVMRHPGKANRHAR